MTMDVYTRIIRSFNRQRIDYIVIGVSGINYYARDARELIMTADFDIFLGPEIGNVLKAVKALRAEGFTIATREDTVRWITRVGMQDIVKRQMSMTCSNPYGNMVDLCLSVSGFSFDELARHATVFKAGRVPVKVGRLRDLLKTKEIAARRKDELFLSKYKHILEEE